MKELVEMSCAELAIADYYFYVGEIKSEIREQIDAKVVEWKEEGRAK
jgi:DNA helicase TIP49 (TBP-interacting protein)